MRIAFVAVAALALTSASIDDPAVAQAPSPPRDVGSMNYPSPLPQGTVQSTMPVRTNDTSSAAFPAPLPQGSLGTTTVPAPRTPTDTGNMAYPAPVPQGTTGTTTVK